jgi:putative transposase
VGVKVIRTWVQPPTANAYAECWIRVLRADYLDRIVVFGPRHVEHVLRIYCRHYNEPRPHGAPPQQSCKGRDPTRLNATDRLRGRELLLGALTYEYEAA